MALIASLWWLWLIFICLAAVLQISNMADMLDGSIKIWKVSLTFFLVMIGGVSLASSIVVHLVNYIKVI